MSTLNTTNITNGTDSITVEGAVKGSAKAWVNFNGTGTVAIRASYNVSSITDVNVGTYRVNFTSALANSEYVVVATSGEVDKIATNTKSGDLATSCDVRTTNLTGTYTDVSSFHVAIFR